MEKATAQEHSRPLKKMEEKQQILARGPFFILCTLNTNVPFTRRHRNAQSILL